MRFFYYTYILDIPRFNSRFNSKPTKVSKGPKQGHVQTLGGCWPRVLWEAPFYRLIQIYLQYEKSIERNIFLCIKNPSFLATICCSRSDTSFISFVHLFIRFFFQFHSTQMYYALCKLLRKNFELMLGMKYTFRA